MVITVVLGENGDLQVSCIKCHTYNTMLPKDIALVDKITCQCCKHTFENPVGRFPVYIETPEKKTPVYIASDEEKKAPETAPTNDWVMVGDNPRWDVLKKW